MKAQFLKSPKIAGILWLLAGFLMMLPSFISGGSRTLVGVGIMFLIFGLVTLIRGRNL